MEEKDDRVFLTYEQAVAMLPPGDGPVHTYIEGCPGVLIGADWSRPELLLAIETGLPQLSGPQATAGGHGLCIRHPNEMTWLFIYTGPTGEPHGEVPQEPTSEVEATKDLRGDAEVQLPSARTELDEDVLRASGETR